MNEFERSLAKVLVHEGGYGVIGPGTLAALRGINDHDALIARILDRRMTLLKNLKIWQT
ncbi:putative peptidoglycan binding protein [Rhizobium sp. PP-F2F-G20b]|nr:putative peptidoglycan binding protein [Rhizobium sp. PP-F2F-G20b]